MLRGRIGIAQYLESQNIGYWQYVSICPKSAYQRRKRLGGADFWHIFKGNQGSAIEHFQNFDTLPLIT